jgi:signal peptidase
MKKWMLIAAIGVATAALLLVALASGWLPYRLYVVHTGSMAPTIQSTSAVIVRNGDYRVGQVVSFTENGDVVTHRLVGVGDEGSIVTKGDANATNDPWRLTTGSIIGEVVATVPHLGYWLVFLKNPLGLLVIFLSVAVCWQLWTFGNQAESRARRRRHLHRAPRTKSSRSVYP